MDDLVSRQAAIDVLWKSPMFTSYSVLKILSDRLNELPAVGESVRKSSEQEWHERETNRCLIV